MARNLHRQEHEAEVGAQRQNKAEAGHWLHQVHIEVEMKNQTSANLEDQGQDRWR